MSSTTFQPSTSTAVNPSDSNAQSVRPGDSSNVSRTVHPSQSSDITPDVVGSIQDPGAGDLDHRLVRVPTGKAGEVALALPDERRPTSSRTATGGTEVAKGSPTAPDGLTVTTTQKDREQGERKDFHQKIYKTPKEATAGLLQAAQNKADLPILKLILLSFLSGIFAAFGGTFAIIVGKGVPTWPIGIQHLLFGFCFHVGLVFIVLFGGELFTGNCMIMLLGLMGKAITWRKFVVSIVVSFVFNFLGCCFAGAFLVYYAEVFNDEPYLSAVQDIAFVKCTLPIQVLFLRSISANWLVNLAIFMAAQAESIEGKMVACMIPIMTFASIGFEHSVANMFFVPLGLMYGAQSTFWVFLYRNLILVTIGNFIGGGIGVGASLWYVYIYNTKVAPLKRVPDDKFKTV